MVSENNMRTMTFRGDEFLVDGILECHKNITLFAEHGHLNAECIDCGAQWILSPAETVTGLRYHQAEEVSYGDGYCLFGV